MGGANLTLVPLGQAEALRALRPGLGVAVAGAFVLAPLPEGGPGPRGLPCRRRSGVLFVGECAAGSAEPVPPAASPSTCRPFHARGPVHAPRQLQATWETLAACGRQSGLSPTCFPASCHGCRGFSALDSRFTLSAAARRLPAAGLPSWRPLTRGA